jgi:hypothetical protein
MGRCCCCGGPFPGPCTSILCPCNTSNVYTCTIELIGGGVAPPGSATNPSTDCCGTWNGTWSPFRIHGVIGSPFFLSCGWRHSKTTSPCTIQQSCHLYVLSAGHPSVSANPCRVYLEFSFNSGSRVDANTCARYYTDSFDCDAGGTFIPDSFTFKCTGWPADIVVTKV